MESEPASRPPIPVREHEVSGRQPLSCPFRLPPAAPPVPVDAQRGDVVVGHHLEDDVLVAVAEGAAEGVGGVGRAGPVQHDGPLAGREVLAQLVPAAVRPHLHPVQGEPELAALVRVEVVVAGVVRVQDDFLGEVRSSVEEDVLEKSQFSQGKYYS